MTSAVRLSFLSLFLFLFLFLFLYLLWDFNKCPLHRGRRYASSSQGTGESGCSCNCVRQKTTTMARTGGGQVSCLLGPDVGMIDPAESASYKTLGRASQKGPTAR